MTKISYAGYRFPPVIIQQAVWLYARFTLSFRDVARPVVDDELLAEALRQPLADEPRDDVGRAARGNANRLRYSR